MEKVQAQGVQNLFTTFRTVCKYSALGIALFSSLICGTVWGAPSMGESRENTYLEAHPKPSSIFGRDDLTNRIMQPINNPIMCVDRECLETEFDTDQLEALRLLAVSGDARAQNSMGLLSLQGKMMRPSPYKAGIYFIQSALQGNAQAQNNLGVLHYQGHGVDRNYTIAFQWFERSAKQGWYQGQYNLGQMYMTGSGVFEDQAEGLKWFEKAAEQGYDIAQFRVANAYLNGVGTRKDKQKAVMWFEKACKQDHAQACLILEKMKFSLSFAIFR